VASVRVYVLYDGEPGGPITRLAAAVAHGAASVPETEVVQHTAEQASVEAMLAADAIILGSPNWHGPTATLKAVLDRAGLAWEQGQLVGRVGAAFTSGWSRAGGQEMTLLMLLHVLLAHGLIIVGLPWSRRVARYTRWLQRGRGQEHDPVEGGLFTEPGRASHPTD